MKHKNIFYCVAWASSILVAGCGGGGGSSSPPPPPPTPVNISLPANGGTVTATASAPTATAGYLIDGLTTTINFWAGVVTNDSVTVTFNKIYAVSKFVLYLNATSTSDTKIQISADGTIYSDLNLFSGTCSSLTVGSGKIDCTFSTNSNLKAMRVVVLNTSSPSSIELYELEVTGQ